MVMPVPNYVKLEPEKPKRMLLDRWWWENRMITDPKSKMLKSVEVMVFHCVEEDGEKVDKTFSVLSFKLQETLAPYVETSQIFDRHVEIIHYPRDYASEYAFRLV